MDTMPFRSMALLLSATLTEVEAVNSRLTSSFGELISSAVELASAERATLSLVNAVPDDEEDEDPQVADGVSLFEDAKYDMTSALERTLYELAEQERVLDAAHATLYQIRDALRLDSHELSPSMELGPKPGCVCS